jgi:hypothetical protein
MLSTDLRSRFLSKYKGDIKDPILYILLDSIEAYQNDLFDKLILSSYTSWNNQINDGMFEVLRRNLFGYFFPGPSYTIAQASLRDVKTSSPILLDFFHPLNLQDSEGNKNLFCPMKKACIVPAYSNDIVIDVNSTSLRMGFNVLKFADEEKEFFFSLYFNNVDPIIIEKIKCRITRISGYQFERNSQSAFKGAYPQSFNMKNDFFQTPYENSFIHIPSQVFFQIAKFDSDKNIYWLYFDEMDNYYKTLEKNVTLNSFVVWNLIEKELITNDTIDGTKFVINNIDMSKNETIFQSIYDISGPNEIEYINSSYVLDPSYPYQYTAYPNIEKDAFIINLSNSVTNNIKIKYFQYDLSDLTINIPAGRPFSLNEGLDESLRSVQTLIPTSRNELLNNKELIWNYFREQYSSRNKVITKEDIKAFIQNYPQFSMRKDRIDYNNIKFEEKIGRLRGFITPFTEIIIPVRFDDIFNSIDLPHFEKDLGFYLKSKSVIGNFVKISFKKVN